MRKPFFDYNKLHVSILFLLIGLTASAQDVDALKPECNLKINIDTDSVLLIRKHQSFKASVFVKSQNEMYLNRIIYDSEHYFDNGICYELQGLYNGKFVSYKEFEGAYGLDVDYTFINGFSTDLSKDITYDCNPFEYHYPISNRIYRFRVFFRLKGNRISSSEWKYVYVVRRKGQIKELKKWRRLGIRNSIKTQISDSLNIDSCLKKAVFCLRQKEFEMSREYSLKAIEMDSLCGEAYLLIGYAYGEFTRSLEVKYFHKKLIFCLAVEKFQKAMEVDPSVTEKAESLMESYSRHFLLRDEFHDDFKDGDKFRVNYWINEETTFRYSKY
ncbi:MAG: hypothetical protein JEZ01_03165 [Labilibaculum sp.]|nr:hypothetical protein [Labilibaculum sp.]MBI9056752.1 hypothetical protein [Labilibaculum sp.]